MLPFKAPLVILMGVCSVVRKSLHFCITFRSPRSFHTIIKSHPIILRENDFAVANNLLEICLNLLKVFISQGFTIELCRFLWEYLLWSSVSLIDFWKLWRLLKDFLYKQNSSRLPHIAKNLLWNIRKFLVGIWIPRDCLGLAKIL